MRGQHRPNASFVRAGSGYVFMTKRTRTMASRLASIASDNARRIPCPICGLAILPEAMASHMAAHPKPEMDLE